MPQTELDGIFNVPHVLDIKKKYEVDVVGDLIAPRYLPFAYKDNTINVMFTLPSRAKFSIGETLANEFTYSGPIISFEARIGNRSEYPFLEKCKTFKKDGGRIIYACFGTVAPNLPNVISSNFLPTFYQYLFDITEKLPNTLLVLSTYVDPATYTSYLKIPSNVIIERFVPQLEILEIADVFVTHAGNGSVNESLYFGVPMVLVPFFADQPSNASWVASIGVGINFPTENPIMFQHKGSPERKSLNFETLDEAIKSLLNNKDIREKSKFWSDEIKRMPGFVGIVNDIEKLIH